MRQMSSSQQSRAQFPHTRRSGTKMRVLLIGELTDNNQLVLQSTKCICDIAARGLKPKKLPTPLSPRPATAESALRIRKPARHPLRDLRTRQSARATAGPTEIGECSQIYSRSVAKFA